MARADLLPRDGRGLLVVATLALAAQSAAAALCGVPSVSHPTVGAAVRDLSCTTIQLAAGTYPENVVVARDVAIAGAGASLSIVAGAIEVSGAATDAALARLALDGGAAGVAGCWPALLSATAGARLVADDDVAVTNSGVALGGCRLFADSFESGGTLAWSMRLP